jgi:hypothetical protein
MVADLCLWALPDTPRHRSDTSTPPAVEESLVIRTPKRLRAPKVLLLLEKYFRKSPTELPASAAPARMAQGRPKRARIAQKLYTNMQYKL